MASLDDILGGYALEVDEQFTGPELDLARWIPYYLPHWAGRVNSRARFRLPGGHLELLIEDDQPPWLPAIEGDLRVSSLQTGLFAGPVGSTVGQHRTSERLAVVETRPIERLITPHYGAVELRASWLPHPDYMVALWMIGFEDEPRRSSEICICEIFGSEATRAAALIGMGVHPFSDPSITDDFDKVPAAIDVGEMHRYTAVWTEGDVTFYLDGEPVKHVAQSPAYPMQLMLSIYDLGGQPDREPAAPFVIDHVRVYRPI